MALASAQLGLRFVAVMPEGVSRERRLIIESYGGRGDLLAAAPRASQARWPARSARPRRWAVPAAPVLQPRQPRAHRQRTAQEIIVQIPGGCVDAVVSGVGTGGTLVGLCQGFADFGCDVAAFAARPVTGLAPGWRRVLLVQRPDPRRGRRPLGDLRRVRAGLADRARRARRRGPRGRAAPDPQGVPGRPQLRPEFPRRPDGRRAPRPDARIVTVFPDRMERYFSTELFATSELGRA